MGRADAGCADFMPFGFSRSSNGCGGYLLCLHSFRCCFDEPHRKRKNPQKDTDWYPRFVSNLHGSVYFGGGNYGRISSFYKLLTNPAAPIAVAVDAALKQAQGTTMGTISHQPLSKLVQFSDLAQLWS